jgi:hypothetical protein
VDRILGGQLGEYTLQAETDTGLVATSEFSATDLTVEQDPAEVTLP